MKRMAFNQSKPWGRDGGCVSMQVRGSLPFPVEARARRQQLDSGVAALSPQAVGWRRDSRGQASVRVRAWARKAGQGQGRQLWRLRQGVLGVRALRVE